MFNIRLNWTIQFLGWTSIVLEPEPVGLRVRASPSTDQPIVLELLSDYVPFRSAYGGRGGCRLF